MRYRDGGSISSRHAHAENTPSLCLRPIRPGCEFNGPLAGGNGYIEECERKEESVPTRFDQSLFPGPAVKECLPANCLGEIHQSLLLRSREKSRGNLVNVDILPPLLYINSDLTPAANCDQHASAGMRQIEL